MRARSRATVGWLIFGMSAAAFAVAACRPNETRPDPQFAQGWSPEQQTRWYSATQGSRLMPVAWFRALEQANVEQPFADPANLARFRLLPGAANNLPVGFAIDDGDDSQLGVTKLRWFEGQSPKEHWVGLNCSTCHTAQIEYGGKDLRIDGGPSLFDYQSFVEELDRALVAAHDDAGKFDRFAAKVLSGKDSPANRTLLKDALGKLIAWERRVEAINDTPLRYGYGRVDAFGHIFNKVALFNGAAEPTPNPADAPVSYPHLWDIYRHDRLQWNGIVTNARLPLGGERYLDYGALGRNAGEVIGVFGDVVTKPGNGLDGYTSSLQAKNLIDLEMQLSTLKAPKWPTALFGALDDTDAKRAMIDSGRQIFDQRCASCHANQPGTAPHKVEIVPLRADDKNATDPWMACNAITYRTATGNLKDTPKGYFGSGEKFGAEAALDDQLETVVKGAMLGKKFQIAGHALSVVFGGGGKPRVVIEETFNPALVLAACYAANSPFMAYKSRPLDGIWATAPYLHNGSVANLYELLLPPAQRRKSFRVGTRSYDPALVGYSLRDDAPGNGFVFDTSLRGNSNAGHDYGAGSLTTEQRQALLHYLKTL